MSEKKGIQWGGLVKGVVATAAVVAGAQLVFSGFVPGVIDAAQQVGTAIAESFSGLTDSSVDAAAQAALDGKEVTEPGALAKSIGWLATKIGGIVLAVTGIKYLTRDKDEPIETSEEAESFAAREDAKRLQALIVARMKAQNYQPAMAMGGPAR